MDARYDYKLWIVTVCFHCRCDFNITKMVGLEEVHLQSLLDRIRSGVCRTHDTIQETLVQIVATRCFKRQSITIYGLHTSP